MTNILLNEVSLNATYLPNVEIQPNVHPQATIRNSQITGNVTIDEKVHVVNAVIRADEGTPFYIGKYSNIQDFAVLHGYTTQEEGIPVKDNLVCIDGQGYFSIYIGENVSISHGVLVHGPSAIGNNTFVGFKSTIDAAQIGKNVEIGAHAYIKRVIIPDNVGIVPGAIITRQEDVDKFIAPVSGINKKIVAVNLEMTEVYNKNPETV